MALAIEIDRAERGISHEASPSSPSNISSDVDQSSSIVEDKAETTRTRMKAAHKFLSIDCQYRNGRSGKFMASKGFPGVVTFQEQHKNMEFIRNFSRLGKLLILDIGHELGARCDEIQALIEEEHKEEEQLCQTEGYKRPLGAGPVSEKVHDLLKSSRELYHEYMSTVKDYVYSKTKLHEAHLDPFFDMIEEFHCRGTLEKGDLAYYNSPEEICIITHPEPKWMMRLIYSCVGKWLIRKLPAKGFSQYSRHVPTATQNFIVCGMYILSTIVLILGPVSIMLLSELTKPETCALVVVSTIVFVVFASSMHQYQRAHTILAALGYLAVMAGFAEAAKQFLG